MGDPQWDQSVATLAGAGPFHGTAWTRVLRDAYGYRPCFFVEREHHRLKSVLPLIEVDSWFGGRRGVSLPFADAVAPLVPDEESFQRLYASALAWGRERKWRYLELRGGRAWFPQAPASTTFHRHIVPLENGEDAQFAACDDATRRAVRKAERAQLAVTFSQDLASVTSYYALHCVTRRRHGVPPQPFGFFARIHEHLIARGSGTVALARLGEQVVAGAIFLQAGKTALFKFGADDGSHRELRPGNLVLWRAIQHFRRAGAEVLDLGRTSLAQEGLRRYKLGWGSNEQRLEYFRHGFGHGEFLEVPDEAAGWHTRIFRLLPPPLFRLAGRVLYPHLG